MSRRLFDCFLFNAELDLLEFRLDLLADVVDHHVLVEAPRTYSGTAKPLHFAENADRFARHAERIIHVVVDDLPMPDPGPAGRWVPELFQRRAIGRGLTEAAPDDVVLLCDVDEIPDPAVMAAVVEWLVLPVALEMQLSYLRANWMSAVPWTLPRMAPLGSFDDLQRLRIDEPALLVRAAGCHFSYLTDDAEISRKMRDNAHDEFDTPLFTDLDFLQACVAGAVFPLTNELLTVAGPETLSAVQTAMLAARPDAFRFDGVPPEWERRALAAYGHRRRAERLPTPVRRALDVGVRRLLNGGRDGE